MQQVRAKLVHIDQGQFQGQFDAQGRRLGVGQCMWADGAIYNGDWAQNVRHGNGRFVTKDGIVYEGQWVNDVKHGEGRLTYRNGEKIEGFWRNDRLNGIARQTQPGGKPQNVIYKDDMLIQVNESGVSGCDYFYVFSSLFLMCMFYAAIPLGLLFDPYFDVRFGITMGVVYVFYMIWSCCCHPSTRYVSNLVTLQETFSNIERAI